MICPFDYYHLGKKGARCVDPECSTRFSCMKFGTAADVPADPLIEAILAIEQQETAAR